MQAVILAGGLGSRLRPVTYEIPKPLIPVKKKPIINYLIELFASAHIEDIFLIVNISDKADFERWSKTWSKLEGMEKVTIIYEDERRGTFGALNTVRDLLKEETFILSNGDTLIELDIDTLIKKHRECGTLVTTALVRTRNPIEYGLAVLRDKHIDHFTKDPQENNSGFISAGLHVVEPVVLDSLNEKEQSMEKEILPALCLKNESAGAIMEQSRFYECGTLARWEEAIKEW